MSAIDYVLPEVIENGAIDGSVGATLNGNNLDNVLTGGTGDDTLRGGTPHWASAGGVDRTCDVNGDGRSDLIEIDANGLVHVWLSMGTHFATETIWSSTGTPLDRFGDFNGDGTTDLLRINSSTFGPDQKGYVELSSGASFDAATVWGTNFLPTDQIGDFNGDGRSDIIQFWGAMGMPMSGSQRGSRSHPTRAGDRGSRPATALPT